ncbi:MAG TPA: biotin/lipoyl-binding protein, partial [Candidatus Paceibacterota bacterium]|nr:biotin/lipoyl-binding protein [Candidatus Paceibacterota bacterium]
MSKIKQIWAKLKPKLKSKKFIIGAIILLLVIFMISRNGGEKNNEVHEVKRGEFVKSVSVSGKVIAIESVDLAFETSGRVARVNKRVGDKVREGEVIVALNSSELQAAREKAQADVLAEEAELAKLKSTENDDTEVANDRRLVINALMDAYAKADDAIRNKVDQFFENPRTLTPEIKYSFRRYSETKDRINDARKNIEQILKEWQEDVADLSPDTYVYKQSDIDRAFNNLTVINRFLDDVSLA